MKRILTFSLLLLFIVTPLVHALDWAHTFVAWNGKVYIVNKDNQLNDNEIGMKIGEVKRLANCSNHMWHTSLY